MDCLTTPSTSYQMFLTGPDLEYGGTQDHQTEYSRFGLSDFYSLSLKKIFHSFSFFRPVRFVFYRRISHPSFTLDFYFLNRLKTKYFWTSVRGNKNVKRGPLIVGTVRSNVSNHNPLVSLSVLGTEKTLSYE